MTVTAPRGFVAGGVHCGIKPSGDLDLALVATADSRPVPAAGVFTQNLSTAAPVVTTRRHLEATGGLAAAVILNSGNANAATGATGLADAEATCQAVADELGCAADEVLVCSTGLIGIPLPIDTLLSGVSPLATALRSDGGSVAAEAIMTTDTVAKEVVVEGPGFLVGGIAKGAAMLAPNMATMLAVLTTDAEATPEQLKAALVEGVRLSFNAMSVDGCTSTNDTVLLFASGAAGPVDQTALAEAVADACADLARQMVGDAEGATKVVEVRVVGAATDEEAERAARKVADSNLCKCSWYGQDPYWGRILSELGSSGVEFDPDTVKVSYGGITVCRRGVASMHDATALGEIMAAPYIEIEADLGIGRGQGSILTNDLTHAYVDENMGDELMADADEKAAVLVEALPYIRRLVGHVVVVKYGGNAMSADLSTFAEDIVLLHSVGLKVVVVHGGGPQIGELLGRLGIETRFVDGLRVTDADTLDVARMVLVGKVNREIVSAVNVHGPLAVGISGEDGAFLRATPHSVELGFVGDVESVDPTLLERLLDSDLIPVVATIAMDAEGQAYNVNADTAAGAIAAALQAEKLVFLTDVEGVRTDASDPTTLLNTVTADDLDAMVADGSVREGMIPKVASCTAAVRKGVGHAHVLDGRVPHVLLLEFFTHSGIGTMVTR